MKIAAILEKLEVAARPTTMFTSKHNYATHYFDTQLTGVLSVKHSSVSISHTVLVDHLKIGSFVAHFVANFVKAGSRDALKTI